MNIRKILAIGIFSVLFIEAIVFVTMQMQGASKAAAAQQNSQSAAVKNIDSTIVVSGMVTAEDQATLHFQTPGKLVSVLKEGDSVSQGEKVAQLDTYPIQQQLTYDLNLYKSQRDTFDQAQQDQSKNITQVNKGGQLNFYGVGLPKYGTDPTATDYLDQAAQRILDQNQADLNNSVIMVQIQNYALQMATLTSPLSGVVYKEDVDIAGQNITPQTAFTVADPSTKVFRATVPAANIDYIATGMNASVLLDGGKGKINGTIVKIYPAAGLNVVNGGNVSQQNGGTVEYAVDIQSDDITSSGKFDQTGTAIIMTNAENVTLIPAWTVLSNKYVWVINNGKQILRSVTTGKTHGDQIEITSGLSQGDRVITDPKSIPSGEYQFL